MPRALELADKVFGKLTALEPVAGRSRRSWLCICSCEEKNTVIVQTGNLTNGNVKSCGCLIKDILKERNINDSPSRKYSDPTTSTRNSVIYRYVKNAKFRGLSWNLTIEQCVLLFQGSCYYCGSEPLNVCQMYGGTRKPLSPYRYNGIDRINNETGYEFNNVVSCCMICNTAKNDMTSDEFESWIVRLINYRAGKHD